MRIVYVAKHGQPDNDDEGAIAHGIRQLGHDVICLSEVGKARKILQTEGDFLLFHKWEDIETLQRVTIPKVFWYFDLVNYPDPVIQHRNQIRMQWMNSVVPLVDLGFCTDGDWVNQDDSGKLIRLMQGADSRVTGRGTKLGPYHPILFTGIRKGGKGRTEFVDNMKETYDKKFLHVEQGLHQRELADLIASTKIVVAPDAPVTDHYWSNRVYMMLGYGAFLLHPYCRTLAKHYTHGTDIIFYFDRNGLHRLIKHYLEFPENTLMIQQAALKRTLAEHTYTHRCEDLIRTVKERIGI